MGKSKVGFQKKSSVDEGGLKWQTVLVKIWTF
jgi:hypothetical protein